ncbi:MAG: hypothetical protein K2Q32_06595 [Alphaproteobacteria bacterium]|nr:hypothetical protein [Alphaproteobacteria bacterium]
MDEKTYPVAPLGMLGKVYLLNEKDHTTYKKIHTYGGCILTAFTLVLFATDQYFKTTSLSQYLWLLFLITAIYMTILFKFASRGTRASEQETSDLISSKFSSSSVSSKMRGVLMRVFQIFSILFIIWLSAVVAYVVIDGKPFPTSILCLYIVPILFLIVFHVIRKRTK